MTSHAVQLLCTCSPGDLRLARFHAPHRGSALSHQLHVGRSLVRQYVVCRERDQLEDGGQDGVCQVQSVQNTHRHQTSEAYDWSTGNCQHFHGGFSLCFLSAALVSPADSEVIDLKVVVALGAFNVLVCDQSCNMADIKVQGRVR